LNWFFTHKMAITNPFRRSCWRADSTTPTSKHFAHKRSISAFSVVWRN
jgi:hypothetical protein